MFNVKDFGAVGDGATDDAVAVQAAIDAAAEAGGGTVWFPPGEYALGGPLDMMDPRYDGTTFDGGPTFIAKPETDQ